MSHRSWNGINEKYWHHDFTLQKKLNVRMSYTALCLLMVMLVMVSFFLYSNVDSLSQKCLLLKISCIQVGQYYDNWTQAGTVLWNDTRLDILHMEQFHFDTRFKNPCWFETLISPEPYQRNVYSSYSGAIKRMLKNMTLLWGNRLSRNESLSHRLRCLPYFYIIGQPKSGSTDLFWRISRHPDVVTPPIKELHWWSRGRQGRQVDFSQVIPLEDYIDMFDKAAYLIESCNYSLGSNSSQNPLIIGEASVSLFWDNPDWYKYPENRHFLEPQYTNPNYIRHLMPDVKLILILRNPTDRLFSDYLYFTEENKSAKIFHELVLKTTNLFNTCAQKRSVRECVYDEKLAAKTRARLRPGMYSVYLEDWLRIFDRNQILILRLEDYAVYPEYTMNNIFKFLKMRDLTSKKMKYILEKPIENKRSQSNNEYGDMFPETRQLLDDFYSPFNRHLAELVNDERFLWKEPK